MTGKWNRTFFALGIALILAGCQGEQAKLKDEIDAGEVALGGDRFDVAIDQADQALRTSPSAQAYYLRGRAEEDRPKPDDLITQSDLDRAKSDYQCALDLHPPRPLAARCRAEIGNIEFQRGSYAAAIFHWTFALDDLPQADARANDLYKIGQAQQRLGRFDDADKTLGRVVHDYGDQDLAAQAQGRIGIRGFYVRVGSFATAADAQGASKAAADAGLNCKQAMEAGLVTVKAGPYVTYTEAVKAKGQIAAAFPGADVTP